MADRRDRAAAALSQRRGWPASQALLALLVNRLLVNRLLITVW